MARCRRLICGLCGTNWDCGLRLADSLALAANRRLFREQLSDEQICQRCYVGGSGLHCNCRMWLGCVDTHASQAFLIGSVAQHGFYAEAFSP